MAHDRISYSQCWEDPDILREALKPTPGDRVLSITSGGDNTLMLMRTGVEEVVAVDIDQCQNYLLELKLAAARALSYEEYLAFLGARASNSRRALYARVAPGLSAAAREWWDLHPSLLERGVIHAGRFERFTAFFARHILPRIHGKKTVREFFQTTDVASQASFYATRWDTPVWRFVFSIAASRLMLGRARHSAMFRHTTARNIGSIYLGRLRALLERVPLAGNYFLTYSLTGAYTNALPPYLQEDTHKALVHEAANLSIIGSDVYSYLVNAPDQHFSAYNLSDVFEACSEEEQASLWSEIIRTAKPGARIAYWANLNPRPVPKQYAHMVTQNPHVDAHALRDRVFFYERFHAYTVRP